MDIDVWGLASSLLVLAVVLGTRHLVQRMGTEDRASGPDGDPPGRRVRDMTIVGKACLGLMAVGLVALVVARATDAPWTGWCVLGVVAAAGAGMAEEARRLRKLGLPLIPRGSGRS